MTQEEFLKEIRWFLEFYEKKFNKTQSKVWYELFKQHTAEEFNSALNRHIKNSEDKFFPAPAAIKVIPKILPHPPEGYPFA